VSSWVQPDNLVPNMSKPMQKSRMEGSVEEAPAVLIALPDIPVIIGYDKISLRRYLTYVMGDFVEHRGRLGFPIDFTLG
jgi:hypothetical protein